MAITFAEQSAVTVSTLPISIINGTTTIATLTTKAIVMLVVDMSAMAAGDQYEIKVLEKVVSAGSQLSKSLGVFTGAQDGPFLAPSLILGNGWDYTITKLAGTDRAFSWSAREAS